MNHTTPSSPAATPDEEHALDAAGAGHRAIRGGAVRLVGYAVSIVIGAFGIALLTRHLGVVDFGRYVTVLAVVGAVTGIAEAGLTAIGIREWTHRRDEDRRAFMRMLLGLRVVAAGAGLLVATAFSAIAGYDGTMVLGTAVAGFGLVALVLAGHFSVPLQAELRLTAYTATDVVRQVTTTFAIIAFVVAGTGLLAFFATPLIGALMSLLLTLVLIRGAVPLRPSFRGAEWRALVRDALPVTIAAVVGVIYYRVAVIALSLVSTAEQTGYFSASFRLVEIVIVVPGMLVTAVFPIVARAAATDDDRLAYVLRRLFDVALLLGGLVAVGVVITAPVVIRILAGPSFEPSVAVLQIQGVAIAATFFVASWGYALLALRAHREILLANAIGLAVALAASIVLGHLYGAKGAAVAMTATEGLLAVVYGVLLAHTRPHLRIGVGDLPKGIAVALVALAVGLLIPLSPIPAAIIATGVYVGLAVPAGLIPPELWHALRARLPGVAG